ncbi:hypothetical protein TSL6_00310 [Sulfurovum sp. TSL6]|uniref:hypothetical protein n=1 Tax=Sulfurovum sp. TSL6 TaxID=2826995 RepID=UPI001CC44DB7|nr:hypothetical protein [Sulfurovum sp. TSL6]GIT99524.1 hypothetical protein TSL6_00310 [Sulfurovum sp. TSL6]
MKNLIKFFTVILLASMPLRADIHTDLQSLLNQTHTLNSELSNFTFNQEGSCAQMRTLNQSIEDNTLTIKNITDTMSSFSVTDADLDVLDDLSSLSQNMSVESVRLSMELNTITDTAELFEYSAGLNAILQLSQDIGAMADRILEMADRILIMSDNIGLMADRIITTQMIQNQNIALTQSSILLTQQNMVLLSDSLSTITYNLTLGQIIDNTELLSNEMNQTSLTNSNMQTELASIQSQTVTLLESMTTLLDLMVTNSAKMNHYINADTLTMLGDLSGIHRALSASLETYANTIEQLAPLTDTVILSDATATMLQLTKDIGVMSDRIMQMTNKIYIMADNIGLMSDNIVTTQNIQMTNVALTESSLLTSQSIMLTVIKNFGL